MIDEVQKYYGQTLKTNKDLKTSACCVEESLDPHIKDVAKEIHSDVLMQSYGCGSPIPLEIEGRTLLDLGSGAGRDAFIMSKLVGEHGKVVGVDMTNQQLETAQLHLNYHMEKFGYSSPNIHFRKGFIEDLKSVDILDNSIDVVTSNCVINLSPQKPQVFREIFRVLKPGGELYFSDIFSSQRISQELTSDPVLLGECLSGALYIEDFRRIISRLGCHEYRVVSTKKLELKDSEIENKIGMIDFYSMTLRIFKIDLEDKCEDYGQVAYYQGTLPHSPHHFVLDKHHIFKAKYPVPVCGNTADILSQSRFSKHFRILGDKSRHFGLFQSAPVKDESQAVGNGCC